MKHVLADKSLNRFFQYGVYILYLMLPPSCVWAGSLDGYNVDARVLSLLEDCIIRVEIRIDAQEADSSEFLLSDYCQTLEKVLSDNKMIRPIYTGFDQPVTHAELNDLYYFLSNHEFKDRVNGVFNFEQIGPILDGIYTLREGEESGWFDALIAWLKGTFLAAESEQDYQWLLDMIERIIPSKQTVNFIFYGCLISIVLIALLVIVMELRAAEVFKRYRYDRKQLSDIALPEEAGTLSLSLLDIRKLPLAQQAVALLILCIDVLVSNRYLPGDGSYTNQELLSLLIRKQKVQSGSFASVIHYAELTLYGGYRLQESDVDDCFNHAERLIRGKG